MKKALLLLLPCFAVAVNALDPIAISKTSETTTLPPPKQGLTFMEDSSWNLTWRFTENAVAKDLTGVNSTLFNYMPQDESWSQSITGSIHNATNGEVTILFTPANTATNGTFNWILRLTDGTTTLCYAWGNLGLLEQFGN